MARPGRTRIVVATITAFGASTLLRATVAAQTTAIAQPTRAAPTAAARARGVRPRFAAGFYAGYAGGGAFFGAGALLYVRGGVQFSDLIGLDLQTSAVTIILGNDVRTALTLEFAVADWISLGTGAAVHVLLTNESGLAMLYGLPLRVAFHALTGRGRNGARHALEILLEGDAGVVQDVWGTGGGFVRPLAFGGAAYLGIGGALY